MVTHGDTAVTSLRLFPAWLLISDPESEPPREEVIDRFERLTGALIQLGALRKLGHHMGEYLKHVKTRARIARTQESDGDAGGSSGARPAAGRRRRGAAISSTTNQ